MQRCCPTAHVVDTNFETTAALLKAISDPIRLTMLATLSAASNDVCVCDFTDALPLNQPTVSHHLRILREAGLVSSKRRGTWVYYRIAPDARKRIDRAVQSVFPKGTSLEDRERIA